MVWFATNIDIECVCVGIADLAVCVTLFLLQVTKLVVIFFTANRFLFYSTLI